MTTTMIRSYRVTPTLFVGDVPACGGTRVETVEGAVALIDSREIAVLPHGSWATARDVLRAVGVDEATASERIHFAQTATFAT